MGEFGGHGNVAAVVAALEAALSARGVVAPTPWYFPRPDAYRELLKAWQRQPLRFGATLARIRWRIP